MLKISLITIFSVLSACQMAPTKIKNEVGGIAASVVLVDTRSQLDFTGYHVPGSVHLRSDDFIILKNPATRLRQFDSDLEQTVERLAKRGISPNKKIILIGSSQMSDENKKWQWLLNQLQVSDISLVSLQDYIKANTPIVPKPQPDRAETWPIQNKDAILKQAAQCFVAWTDDICMTESRN